MKVYLRFEGRRYTATPAGEHAVIGGLTCCGAAVRAVGKNMQTVEDRRYEADAFTKCCGVAIGTLVVKPATLFGIEEDNRVLNGRCRVY